MNAAELLRLLDTGVAVAPDTVISNAIDKLNAKARWATNYLNGISHKEEIVRAILSELIDRPVAESVHLRPPFYVNIGRNIHFGEDIHIDQGCSFLDLGAIHIGSGCVIDANVTILASSHGSAAHEHRVLLPEPVHIGDHVLIGTGAMILPGSVIGKGAVIEPASVVSGEVLEGTIVSGFPASYKREV